MFQYALYLALRERNKIVKIDASDLENGYAEFYEYSTIFECFLLDRTDASRKEIIRYADKQMDYVSRIRRKLGIWKKSYIREQLIGEYDSSIVNANNCYLDGYWQTEDYFKQNKDVVRNAFKFRGQLNEKSALFIKQITSSDCAVSLHIRLGDYLSESVNDIYGGICTEAYYREAIRYFKEKYSDPVFFVFSDDIEKAVSMLREENIVFVTCNDKKNAWQDMYLMSQCRHNIIANSSFSWWGAWLNNHEDKEVIAPQKWTNNGGMNSVCPEEWIRM